MALHRWKNQKAIFNVKVFRYLIGWFGAVPIVVYLTREVPEKLQFLLHDDMISLHLALPFKWAVLWFASLLYVFGFLLYSAFCPSLLRQYSTFADYKARGHSPRFIVTLLCNAIKRSAGTGCLKWFQPKPPTKALKILLGKGHAERLEPQPTSPPPLELDKNANGTAITVEIDQVYYKIECGPKIDRHDEIQEEIFWELYEYWESVYPVIRWIIALMLLAAGCMIGYTVWQNIWAVIEYLWKYGFR